MQILCAENISFKYPHAEKTAVENVSFQIEKGTYTAIVGDNGSGKSTLARILCSLEKPDSGTVHIEPNVQIGLVFQNPKNQIISGVISRDTAIGPENLGVPKSETELRVIESLNIVDMLDRAESSTLSLSLGQTQKIAIAGIVALRPNLLFFDEALSMLDSESRNDIYKFMDYWHSLGNTIIHITHDDEAILKAQNIIQMNEGRVTFYGRKSDFEKIQNAQKEKTESTFRELKNQKKSKSEIEKKEVVLSFQNVSFDYNKKSGIKNISFNLKKGSLTAITGVSGSGKSTILELAAGLLKPTSGNIYSSQKIALCQQNASGALFENFAADDVAFGPKNQGKTGKELFQIVKKSMEAAAIPYEKFGDRHSFELSGGEQRRLAIAGILALDTDIILFDEPTAGLDENSRIAVLKMLRKLSEDGKTILFSTHKSDEAEIADEELKILELNKSNINLSDAETQQNINLYKKNVEPLPSFKMLNFLRTASHGLSQKTKKSSLISKLPPAWNIVLFLAIFIFSIASRKIYLCVSSLLISLTYCVLAKFPMKKLFSAILKIIPFLIFFGIFQMIFIPSLADEKIYFAWKFFTVSKSKIFYCVASFIRTVSSIAAISGFYFSIPEYDLLDGISVLLKPLSLLKIPIRYFILTMEIMFRFIPLLIDEAASIIKTQSIRGGLREKKGFFAKISALIPLFVPLIAQTIKRAEALADALTVRGLK